jgi:hypothetical protein
MSEAADKPERSGHARALAGTPTWAFTPGVNTGALAHILVEGQGSALGDVLAASALTKHRGHVRSESDDGDRAR